MNIRQLLEQGHRPFASHPQVDRYFPAAAIEDARVRLARSIERGDGPCLVIGSAGTGKSLLLQALAAQYQGQFDVVLLACSQICTRRALLQAILFELGLPYHQRDEGEVRLALLDQLLSNDQGSAGLLLLVDEAQSLSVTLLEELRMMTNLVRGGMPRVRLVLAGAPALEETFAAPELESFSQRLAARCYLSPFGRDETIQYVRAQLAASGAEPDAVFATDAWDAIVEATDGVPRLVNQLCDRALLAVDADRRPRVDRQIVQAAWADLQQLPTPWDTPGEAPRDDAQDVVEFGSLGDAVDVPAPTIDEPVVEPADVDLDDADEPSDVVPLEPSLDEVAEPVDPLPIAAGTDEDAIAEADEGTLADTATGDGVSAGVQPGDSQSSDSRPRVYAGDADEADNPFDEQFDEEEIVLDNFVAWDAVWREHTPQVENLRDPQFAARVQDALDAASSVGGDSVADNGADSSSRGIDVGDAPSTSPLPTASYAPSEIDSLDALPETEGLEPAAVSGDESADSADEHWPPLRLAVVSDVATLQPVPLIRSAGPGVVTATAAFDPVMPEAAPADCCDDVVDRASARAAADVAIPSAAAVQGSRSQVAEAPVLVIEEEPDETPATPPVRRQEYRQLFSRLRGG